MTALPTLAYIRRHAVPNGDLANLTVARKQPLPALVVRRGHSRLVVTWHVGCDGHPVCQWGLDEPPVSSG